MFKYKITFALGRCRILNQEDLLRLAQSSFKLILESQYQYSTAIKFEAEFPKLIDRDMLYIIRQSLFPGELQVSYSAEYIGPSMTLNGII